MTVDEAPVRTVVVIGHNLYRKQADGTWLILLEGHIGPDYDDLHKAARTVYVP